MTVINNNRMSSLTFYEDDKSDDFDVNKVPMTFHPVVKDAGATLVSAKDV